LVDRPTVLASAHATVTPLNPATGHLHQVQTVTSVTIRPLIPTPTQWVSRI
jgi:hypothetical protein